MPAIRVVAVEDSVHVFDRVPALSESRTGANVTVLEQWQQSIHAAAPGLRVHPTLARETLCVEDVSAPDQVRGQHQGDAVRCTGFGKLLGEALQVEHAG